jgi:hypothetical protein
METRQNNEVNRVVNRWTRYELIVLDEMCYVAMPEMAAELLFQVIGGRAERAAERPKQSIRFIFHKRGPTQNTEIISAMSSTSGSAICCATAENGPRLSSQASHRTCEEDRPVPPMGP